MDRRRQTEAKRPARRLNWTTIALIGGLVIVVVLIVFFATIRNPDQDKLTSNEVVATQPPAASDKLCSSKATYYLIKRELFRRAAQLRGSEKAAYDQLAGYAVVRMDNPVMESEDSSTGTVNCSGSLSLDLPPGVAVAGGRRTLTSDVSYTVEPEGAVQLQNADAVIASLATLARVGEPLQSTPELNEIASDLIEGNLTAPDLGAAPAPAPVPAPQPARPPSPPPIRYPGRPSFDCSQANSRGAIAVCSDTGLSALDVNMAKQYRRALAAASPEQRQLLEWSGNRFLGYRDRCRNRQCIADAYLGRMREIRGVMEGRWQPQH
jgi:hypothetical protein